MPVTHKWPLPLKFPRNISVNISHFPESVLERVSCILLSLVTQTSLGTEAVRIQTQEITNALTPPQPPLWLSRNGSTQHALQQNCGCLAFTLPTNRKAKCIATQQRAQTRTSGFRRHCDHSALRNTPGERNHSRYAHSFLPRGNNTHSHFTARIAPSESCRCPVDSCVGLHAVLYTNELR